MKSKACYCERSFKVEEPGKVKKDVPKERKKLTKKEKEKLYHVIAAPSAPGKRNRKTPGSMNKGRRLKITRLCKGVGDKISFEQIIRKERKTNARPLVWYVEKGPEWFECSLCDAHYAQARSWPAHRSKFHSECDWPGDIPGYVEWRIEQGLTPKEEEDNGEEEIEKEKTNARKEEEQEEMSEKAQETEDEIIEKDEGFTKEQDVEEKDSKDDQAREEDEGESKSSKEEESSEKGIPAIIDKDYKSQKETAMDAGFNESMEAGNGDEVELYCTYPSEQVEEEKEDSYIQEVELMEATEHKAAEEEKAQVATSANINNANAQGILGSRADANNKLEVGNNLQTRQNPANLETDKKYVPKERKKLTKKEKEKLYHVIAAPSAPGKRNRKTPGSMNKGRRLKITRLCKGVGDKISFEQIIRKERKTNARPLVWYVEKGPEWFECSLCDVHYAQARSWPAHRKKFHSECDWPDDIRAYVEWRMEQGLTPKEEEDNGEEEIEKEKTNARKEEEQEDMSEKAQETEDEFIEKDEGFTKEQDVEEKDSKDDQAREEDEGESKSSKEEESSEKGIPAIIDKDCKSQKETAMDAGNGDEVELYCTYPSEQGEEEKEDSYIQEVELMEATEHKAAEEEKAQVATSANINNANAQGILDSRADPNNKLEVGNNLQSSQNPAMDAASTDDGNEDEVELYCTCPSEQDDEDEEDSDIQEVELMETSDHKAAEEKIAPVATSTNINIANAQVILCSRADPNNNLEAGNNLQTCQNPANLETDKPSDQTKANQTEVVDTKIDEKDRIELEEWSWIECDDEVVEVLSEKEFVEMLSPSNGCIPYLLFYKRVRI